MKLSSLPRTSAFAVLTLGLIGAMACAEEIPDIVVGTGQGKGKAFIEKIGGDNQTGVVRSPLGDSLAIRVVDEFRNPVEGAIVRWTSSAPQATMGPVTNTTNELGIAKSRWTLGQLAGPQTAQVEVNYVPNPSFFHATALPGVASRIVVLGGDIQAGIVGNPLTDSIFVRITDSFDNEVSNVLVSFIYAAVGDSGMVTVANPESITQTGTSGAPTITVTTRTDANGDAKAHWNLGPTNPARLPCCFPRQAVRVSVSGATTAVITASTELPPLAPPPKKD